jgi:hypothetical protein
MLSTLSSARVAITSQLEANPQAVISASVADLIPSDQVLGNIDGKHVRADYKTVAPDGTITAFSSGLGTLIVLHPGVKGNKVEWSCRGYSIHGNRGLPARCRDDYHSTTAPRR